jgi:hypothetical protein
MTTINFRRKGLPWMQLYLMLKLTTSNVSTFLHFEGLEKTTRGRGVNGNLSKFLVVTRSISQIESDAPLF